MFFASLEIWKIVKGIKEPPPSNANLKIKTEYRKWVCTIMSPIALNLVDSQLWHIKLCKGPTEAWNMLYNIHEFKSLSNILFIWHKFFDAKMQEREDLLYHISKVKALAKQLVCLEVPLKDEVVRILLTSLPSSFDNLITILVVMHVKELTMEFVTMRLMHEMTKRKEKEF